jgi:hypothetical protein
MTRFPYCQRRRAMCFDPRFRDSAEVRAKEVIAWKLEHTFRFAAATEIEDD